MEHIGRYARIWGGVLREGRVGNALVRILQEQTLCIFEELSLGEDAWSRGSIVVKVDDEEG